MFCCEAFICVAVLALSISGDLPKKRARNAKIADLLFMENVTPMSVRYGLKVAVSDAGSP